MKVNKFVLPPGKTEGEVLEAIEKAVRVLSPSFVFGYYSLEDIQQEARIFGLEALPGYDNVRPLENFLYRHIYNRLINLVRNKLKRSDAPCRACHNGTPCQPNGTICEKYAVWFHRNSTKANLVRPLDIGNICDDKEASTHVEATAEADAEQRELLELIDVKLPVELRVAYNQIRAGVSVPKATRLRVMNAVKAILGDAVCQNAED